MVATVILRTLFMSVLLLVAFRLMGKKTVDQWTGFDFVFSIMATELAILSIESPDKPLVMMLVPILLLFIMQRLFTFFSTKLASGSRMSDEKPATLVYQGVIDEEKCAQKKIDVHDFLEQLKRQNVERLSDVEFAILEPTGEISVLTKERQKETNTPVSLPLIINGKVCEENLKKIDQTSLWLRQELRKFGYRDIKKIAYLVIDESGNFFVDLKTND
ncbi:DUF421 domain-containing protein [Terrilactibacillus sp. S3-3]|nr:DUF421 domain-containing protein [Terrilactibacillus sp. S3-3]